MALADIEKQYNLMSEATQILQEQLGDDYLDALIENFDNLLNDGQVHVEDGLPDEKAQARLSEIYQAVDVEHLANKDRRLLLQLSLIFAYRKEKIQANHQLTPDAIGFLAAYLLKQVYHNKKATKMLDLGIGTGNLTATLIESLTEADYQNIHAFGVDNDDTLLAIASLQAELENLQLDLYHQDALDQLVVPQVDLIVSDLPIGYYPLDEKAKQYASHFEKGHSYAHFLLIEQGMRQLKADGIGMFLVPAGIFEDENSLPLLKEIQAQGYLQALINLPSNLFTSKHSEKAILLLQKKGPKAKQAQPVLLGDFPLIKDQEKFAKFMAEVDLWQKKNFS
ncbi:site-specific DNA-methyltransferase (adenine-specific) [Ligilactobacillus sp. WC1T17]|uniref:Site-specific DNA-methyltransferase (Adenine-specific) n=1 Tax=Ligilactobacillus ruminis TaxID=1623 RepID=A0ABY1AE28_9LACO|nr:site-specific DNA-methyltransferase (adenine-specific) [Ligilactobacillus ruminis]